MITRHYTTCADRVYLGRLRVLVESMKRHCLPFVMHVLAFDDDVASWVASQNTSSIRALHVRELVSRHPQIRLEKLPTVRSKIDEKLCTWRWWHTLDVVREWGAATQLDSDIMFFSTPEPVFEEIGTSDLAVMPHALARNGDGVPGVTVESHGEFGLYNGGWSYFADVEPIAAMAEYVRQWCHPDFRIHADGRSTYGDQGYLELVKERFRGHVIEHLGACAGPWNVNRWPLTRLLDVVRLGDRPLVSFHYQGFRWAKRTHDAYATNALHDMILYQPYRDALRAVGDDSDAGLMPCNECGAAPGSCGH